METAILAVSSSFASLRAASALSASTRLFGSALASFTIAIRNGPTSLMPSFVAAVVAALRTSLGPAKSLPITS